MSKFLNIQSVEAKLLGKVLPNDIAKMVETYVYRVYNIYGNEVIYANGIYKIKDFYFDEKEFVYDKIKKYKNEYVKKPYKFYLGEVGNLEFENAVYAFSRAIAKCLVDICINGYTRWYMLETFNGKFNIQCLFNEICCEFEVNNINLDNISSQMDLQQILDNFDNTYTDDIYNRIKQDWE